MILKDVKVPPPSPKKYWEDRKWVSEHISEISEKYPNQWVVVADKKIIAAGEDGQAVRDKALKMVEHEDFVIFFSEKGIHVYYENKSRDPNQNRFGSDI